MPYCQQSLNEASRANANVDIRETNDGKGYGLFARNNLSKGQHVFRGKALEIHSHASPHSIQTDWDRHVIMDLPAILVNHSCEANLGIRPNLFGAYDFVALQDIDTGRELLWDYETAENEITCEFQCNCGAPRCRSTLKGFHFNGSALVEAYGEENIAPYLLEQKPQEKTA
ncbi:SET [Seminavis robusta]|uniref:SET n=1 Tax=Seminavis robusta TaxID=568900 RepID=A0A9N8E361_9STRA|nr:SET [Seminavis robusta]|eukprot:Sro497_g154760.1 SET (171) ;mRNA; r:23979-24491